MVTLIIEAIKPLRITTRTRGELTQTPGLWRELPDRAVQQLLRQVPRKIRIINTPLIPQPGGWVEFDSPLFGRCTAKVKGMTIEGVVVSDHSVHGSTKDITIQASWIWKIYKEDSL